MSSHLHETCLIFGGRYGGIAKHNGVSVHLTDNPVLCGQRILSLYYVPGSIFEIRHRPSSPTHEEMTADEIADADRLLKRLCGDAK